ncbi:hypothetical protein Rs2_22001 [Raphanus sativus]|nr:hypothetical protein Rs2_22001 [Raphanus sativus]
MVVATPIFLTNLKTSGSTRSSSLINKSKTFKRSNLTWIWPWDLLFHQMLYISSAPDLSITGFVKTAVFTVCMLCNTVPMIASAEATAELIWPDHPSDLCFRLEPSLQAVALVTISFGSMLVAFMVGVCLVVILRIWHYFFYV